MFLMAGELPPSLLVLVLVGFVLFCSDAVLIVKLGLPVFPGKK